MQNKQSLLLRNQIPKNWQKLKLGEVTDIFDSKRIPLSGLERENCQGEYPYYGASGIIDYIDKYIFDGNYILVAEDGENLRSRNTPVAFSASGKFWVNNHAHIIKAKPHLADDKFILNFILNYDISGFITGSAQPKLTQDNLKRIPFLLPLLPIQQKIASIISAFDDKIENNNKQIKILEEMAQTIFKEWFVHFRFPGYKKVKMVDSGTEYGMIPEGWKVRKLEDKLNILKGKNITKNTIIHGKVPVVAGGLNPAYYHNKANAQCPVITISASGANSGFVNLYQEDVWASDCSYIDRRITPFVYFYYLFLKNKQTEITGLQRGSAQPHVYPKDLMQLTIIDIPEMLVNAFEHKVELMFGALKNLKNQNQCLRQTRDLLLPKLMKGEMKV